VLISNDEFKPKDEMFHVESPGICLSVIGLTLNKEEDEIKIMGTRLGFSVAEDE
jgi:hypothetical protein